MVLDEEESSNSNTGTVNIAKLMQTIKKKKEDLANWDSWVKRHYKNLQDKQAGLRGATEHRRYERQMAKDLRTAEEEYCINIMETAMMSPKAFDIKDIRLDSNKLRDQQLRNTRSLVNKKFRDHPS